MCWRKTKDDFAADFKDLYPVIKSLNDNADYFIKDLEFLPTFPFHYKYLRRRCAATTSTCSPRST